ncbi:MAG: [FeFe] hydrogenase H-cluster radical SAM maturase HydE [Eubacteriales bacterium]|nr:[FeFe] hydrogenase H-cluster radical SAM maturase HydE [Eubacteriales bacterium]
MNNIELINKLYETSSLSIDEYEYLIINRDEESTKLLKKYAVEKRQQHYSNKVFVRGLIEVSNICKNDCYYCGIRKSNHNCDRYRLTKEEILECCNEGYSLGFRTFVLQGGEDGIFTDPWLCDLIESIKQSHPDCAITLSLGERSKESYQKLFDSGADRYLLRHETADSKHYSQLHPDNLSLENRLQCLKNLKEIGFQTGCGFMVGSPYQTTRNIAQDLKFIKEFSPDMCGVGPFIPHKDTMFNNYASGDADLCCYLLSIIRLIKPNILLPATTALGTVENNGRERGILSGANVIMPNLSPMSVRKKYALYDGKISTGEESAQSLYKLKQSMNAIGYEVVVDRGDINNNL